MAPDLEPSAAAHRSRVVDPVIDRFTIRNKYAIMGIAVVVLSVGIGFTAYSKGYKAADTKWKLDAAEQVRLAVLATNEQNEKARSVDLTTISSLRDNRDYYKKLYKNAVDFQPTDKCELSDGLFTQFNEAFNKAGLSE